MKHWLVKLILYLGEYEKTSHNVVDADDEYAAWKLALEGECHNDCHMDEDGGSCWDGTEFRYVVYEATELTEQDNATLRRLRIY